MQHGEGEIAAGAAAGRGADGHRGKRGAAAHRFQGSCLLKTHQGNVDIRIVPDGPIDQGVEFGVAEGKPPTAQIDGGRDLSPRRGGDAGFDTVAAGRNSGACEAGAVAAVVGARGRGRNRNEGLRQGRIGYTIIRPHRAASQP